MLLAGSALSGERSVLSVAASYGLVPSKVLGFPPGVWRGEGTKDFERALSRYWRKSGAVKNRFYIICDTLFWTVFYNLDFFVFCFLIRY